MHDSERMRDRIARTMIGGSMKPKIFVILSALVIVAAACGKNSLPTAGPSTSSSGRPSSTAVIKILSPTPGEVVSTSGVTVKILLTGARIVAAGSTTIRPDEGHVHLKVDGRIITLFGRLEVSTGPLTRGPHLIEIEFAASDHGPFNPRVIETVTVTAQ